MIKVPFIILSILLIHATTSSVTLVVRALPEFSYSGKKGPGRWGGLCPQYSTCRLGKRQSPVNIQRGKAVNTKELGPLTRYYNAVNSTLINNGFNIGVHYEEEAGFIMIDGKKFTLKQMHWHCPSEHRIDGIQYPAELHLVHISDDGDLSVVAILFKYNRPDPLISQIKEKVDELAKEVREGKKEAHVPLGTLDLKPFRKQTRKYYRYVGSLTTPPCNETVIWNILGKVRSISAEQVRAIKAPLLSSCKTNARPCQPLNGRNIMLYDERAKFNTDDDY